MTSPGTLALSTRGLRKSYGSRLALDGLDLSVPTDVVYGFLGPNGAGKTTTMRLLTGLLHPDAGSIELLGRPFARGDRHRLFAVGALVESPSFYPYLSGRANLRELAATGAPVPRNRVEELPEIEHRRGGCGAGGDRADNDAGHERRRGSRGRLAPGPGHTRSSRRDQSHARRGRDLRLGPRVRERPREPVPGAHGRRAAARLGG